MPAYSLLRGIVKGREFCTFSSVCPYLPTRLRHRLRFRPRGKYYFWSGKSKPKSAVGDYQTALATCSNWPKFPASTLICSGTHLRPIY
jgi:hypothetical protein